VSRNVVLIITVATLMGLSIDMAFAQAKKCLVNGKTIYTDGDCPKGAKHEPLRDSATTSLPSLQRGLWKFKLNVDGRPSESEYCGDPIEELSAPLNTYRAMACTVNLSAPDPRTTKAEINCPADNARPDGSARVRKGRAYMIISVPNAQSFKFEFRSQDWNRVEAGEGRLAGGC
jgi:hypothetical protein